MVEVGELVVEQDWGREFFRNVELNLAHRRRHVCVSAIADVLRILTPCGLLIFVDLIAERH